jgi:CheY-like chemotaxis protein
MKNFLSILLVEDNVIEIMKIRRTITTLNNNYKLVEVRNGEEALLYLKAKNTIPDIILLDLNMPKIGGIEFLSILKQLF